MKCWSTWGRSIPARTGCSACCLRTDGEVVHEVTPHIGYLHRCAEKIGENLASPQWIPYTDRMDYLAAMNMNLGLALTIEKLVKMEVPEKAMVLRVIIAELGRVASHLVGMGAYGLDLGTFSPFLYAFREREIILDLFEEVCGARLTYSYITMGGATHDLPERITIPPGLASLTGKRSDLTLSWLDATRLFLDWLDKRVSEYHTLLDEQSNLHQAHGRLGNSAAGNGQELRMHGPSSPRQRNRLGSPPRRRSHLHPHVHGIRVRHSVCSLRQGPARRSSWGTIGAASTSGWWSWSKPFACAGRPWTATRRPRERIASPTR